MGRPGKSIDLHIANGNRRHLSNAEIESRQEHESSIKSGVKNFKATEYVMKNMVAINMFKKLKRLFKNIECIEGLDENIINRYCMLFAEGDIYERLLVNMNNDVDNCDDYTDRLQIYKAIAGVTAGLNKVRDMQLKIEDRLLMNPTARIKNIPKTVKESASDPHRSMFGD
jgi:phage terminase small subunit